MQCLLPPDRFRFERSDMNPTLSQPFVKVAVIENPIEAQLIASILKQDGIPHIIRSYHDTAYDGLFQSHMGWGEIQAPANCRRHVLDTLKTIRSENHDISDII